MNTQTHCTSLSLGRIGRQLLAATLLTWLSTLALAQDTKPPATPPAQPPAVEVEQAEPTDDTAQVEADESDADSDTDFDEDREERRWRRRGHRDDHSVILQFEDATVAPNDVVDAVIIIGGSVASEGTIREAIITVLGNSHVTGPVNEDVVSFFGNTYVNSKVGGDVVAIFGDVELGPEARIGGEVGVIGGKLKRDPAATVEHGVEQVALPVDFGRLEWLKPWLKHCMLLGRPLAAEPGLGWAWGLAIGFLTLYVLLAVMFTRNVEQCVETIETRPGSTLVASLLTLILTPILTVVLMVTIVGFAIIPFFWIALFIAGLFGKAVILAALGRRLTRFFSIPSPMVDYAIAVAIGGAIMLLLYMIPFIGFIAYKLLGILGLGVVVYTMLLAVQRKRELAAAAAAPASALGGAAAATVDAPAVDGVASTEAAPAIADSALPRAGFWIRMGALAIDIILVGIVYNVFNLDYVFDDMFLLLLAAYGAVMWKIKGTTVGGVLCHLKVVRVDGRDVDWGTAIARALGCFLSLVVAGLGFIWVAIDRDRQGWHDKIAGTAVVQVPRGRSLV